MSQSDDNSVLLNKNGSSGRYPRILNDRAIQPLLLEGNLSHNWEQWLLDFKIYMRANCLEDEENQRKVAIFLRNIGGEALKIFNSFNIDMDTCSYEELINKFTAHCKPKSNLTVERHNFLTRTQKMDENLDEFITSLKNLSLTCDLGTLRESLVRDMFIVGLNTNYGSIKEKLLQEDNLTLEKTVTIAKSMELTHIQASQLNKNESLAVVCKVGKTLSKVTNRQKSNFHQEGKSKYSQYQSASNNDQHQSISGMQKACTRCNQFHRYKCPASNVICNLCHKKGHYAKCCRTKNMKTVNIKTLDNENDNENDESTKTFFIRSLQQELGNNKKWVIELKINNNIVKCCLDTGAEANVMSYRNFLSLKTNSKILSSPTKLMSFSGEYIPVKGKTILKCHIKEKWHNIEFMLVDLKCESIIGLPTCNYLELIQRISTVNHADVIKEFNDCFKGLGCLPGKVEITIDDNIQPVIDAPRKIPFKLLDTLKAELEKMECLGVITKVNEPSEWVNSIVIVEKKIKH